MLLYSRKTPFGFVDPDNATDEDMFYAEQVDLGTIEGEVLDAANALRALLTACANVQSYGLDAQSQAEDVAEALLRVVK